mmetsp:Transcript_110253/g.311723  ORF Transcript_110253/g.311723 Transcript_110253/m.311723 type:complete len:111 (-) Transcript_110253:908-1240(-)
MSPPQSPMTKTVCGPGEEKQTSGRRMPLKSVACSGGCGGSKASWQGRVVVVELEVVDVAVWVVEEEVEVIEVVTVVEELVLVVEEEVVEVTVVELVVVVVVDSRHTYCAK